MNRQISRRNLSQEFQQVFDKATADIEALRKRYEQSVDDDLYPNATWLNEVAGMATRQLNEVSRLVWD